MVSRRRSDSEPPQSKGRPATTPQGRENQLISMAADLAEKRIKEGTASAQEIVHFLRLGSSRERLEQEKIARENELLSARAEAIASAARTEELMKLAIDAMRSYRSSEPDEYED